MTRKILTIRVTPEIHTALEYIKLEEGIKTFQDLFMDLLKEKYGDKISEKLEQIEKGEIKIIK